MTRLGFDYVAKVTAEAEGFRPRVYEDSRGYLTIGYGHKLTRTSRVKSIRAGR